VCPYLDEIKSRFDKFIKKEEEYQKENKFRKEYYRTISNSLKQHKILSKFNTQEEKDDFIKAVKTEREKIAQGYIQNSISKIPQQHCTHLQPNFPNEFIYSVSDFRISYPNLCILL
jgi:predicted Holliday junction resolvase-like endonuclease